jgi:alpha-tubulin suppressor-like RCC1 family protein
MVSSGYLHTCAVTTTGGLKCWGYNRQGQLGNGTTIDSSTPVDVSGLTSGVAMVSAGMFHTCAVTTSGGVKCWGDSSDLGGTKTQTGCSCITTPIDMIGLTSGVRSVSAGRSSCAVTIGGGIKCWGFGGSTPTDVSGLTSGVASVSAAGLYNCAVTTAGGVKCWGLNNDGQLGDGTTIDRSTPVDVIGLGSGGAAVSASWSEFYVSCAVTTAGGAKCWGRNQYGALGIGTNTGPDACENGPYPVACSTTPVDVAGLTTGVVSVSVGGAFACASTTAGAAKCWGSNFWGQLGNGIRGEEDTPVDVEGLASGVAAVSVGWGHSCAEMTDGSVRCWGDNQFGQLGDGTTRRTSTPVGVVDGPLYPAGDVDCDGVASSVDALLVLQLDAKLISSYFLPCQQNADANRDRNVNAIDATLILQYVAGLINSLPQ